MITQDIRDSINSFIPTAVFSYGRSFDTALAAAKINIDDYFIHLDPITPNGNITDGTKTASITMGFLKQTKPDSEFDKEQNLDIDASIEEVQNEAELKAEAWLNEFLNTHSSTYQAGTYTLPPATKIKNVMSGVLLQVTLSYRSPCLQ